MITRALMLYHGFSRESAAATASEIASDYGATVGSIKDAVCEALNIRVTELDSRRRKAVIANGRHLSMALCLRLTNKSMVQIGAMHADRDHATVGYARDKFADAIEAVTLPPSATEKDWVKALLPYIFAVIEASRKKSMERVAQLKSNGKFLGRQSSPMRRAA